MPGLVNTGNNQHQSSDNHDGSTLLRICVGEKVVPSPLLESKKPPFLLRSTVYIYCCWDTTQEHKTTCRLIYQIFSIAPCPSYSFIEFRHYPRRLLRKHWAKTHQTLAHSCPTEIPSNQNRNSTSQLQRT